mgnify:CR=1 FL=1
MEKKVSMASLTSSGGFEPSDPLLQPVTVSADNNRRGSPPTTAQQRSRRIGAEMQGDAPHPGSSNTSGAAESHDLRHGPRRAYMILEQQQRLRFLAQHPQPQQRLKMEEARREAALVELLVAMRRLQGQGQWFPCSRMMSDDQRHGALRRRLPLDDLVYWEEEACVDNFVGSRLDNAPLPQQARGALPETTPNCFGFR